MYIKLSDYNKGIKYKKLSDSFIEIDSFGVVNEGSNSDRDEVLRLLDENNLKTTPIEFSKSLLNSKHAEMLTPYSISELTKMKLFKVPNYNIGYALKISEEGTNIVSVHNNEPNVKGIGKSIIKSAIRNGGDMLDHFETEKLNKLYSETGFVEYARDKYNPIYDEGSKFANKYGKIDIIYRKLNKDEK